MKRRKRLLPSIGSSPCQNSIQIRGVRIDSPGSRYSFIFSMPEFSVAALPPCDSAAYQLPVQPMPTTTPFLSGDPRLKNGKAVRSDDRPFSGAIRIESPAPSSVRIGRKSARDP